MMRSPLTAVFQSGPRHAKYSHAIAVLVGRWLVNRFRSTRQRIRFDPRKYRMRKLIDGYLAATNMSDFQVFRYEMKTIRRDSAVMRMTKRKLLATFDSLRDARSFVETIPDSAFIKLPLEQHRAQAD